MYKFGAGRYPSSLTLFPEYLKARKFRSQQAQILDDYKVCLKIHPYLLHHVRYRQIYTESLIRQFRRSEI